jgi:RNA polymerase sigma factor (sigma-70 family)
MIEQSENSPNRLAELIQLVGKSRDKEAFATLFGHFAPRVKSYMRRLGTDDAQAEELMQEAMIMVWRRAHTYDPERSAASTWIFTIARNKRIDGLRRGSWLDIDPNDPTVISEPDQPDDIVSGFEIARQMKEAVAMLPDDQAEAIRLAYYEGLSQSEIAAKLGTPLGTVKSRLRLALQRLRIKISDEHAS